MNIPRHIVSAAVVIVNENNDILLIKGPKRGWEMPGGQVEEEEPLQEAAVREVKEECGLIIEITSYCGIFQNVTRCICNHLFTARAVGGEVITTPEALEVGYFSIEEVRERVTWGNFLERIEYCLDQNSQPFCVSFK
ncbi:NUDIX hydrolase [Halobacillus sp. A5]|uniref:NUDIX hydrolase n=1 Tax=Halobacillus sp. A5 TaxID=2880263 RepID=UPI0020A6CD5C|nr:NUDIX hydrolase [Halobacillus sp. A5]MCP3026503.1 NUDIX hydrolase [Halobacillus sp. A5]